MEFTALAVTIIFVSLFALPLGPFLIKRWLNRSYQRLRYRAFLWRARFYTLFTIGILILLPIWLCICWITIIRSTRALTSDPKIRDQNPAVADEIHDRLQQNEAKSIGVIIPILIVVACIAVFFHRLKRPVGYLWPDNFVVVQLSWCLATLCATRAFQLEHHVNEIRTGKCRLDTLSAKQVDDYLVALGFTYLFVAMAGPLWVECLYRSLTFTCMPRPFLSLRDWRVWVGDWLEQRRRRQQVRRARTSWFGRTSAASPSVVPELPSTVTPTERRMYRDEANRATWPRLSWF